MDSSVLFQALYSNRGASHAVFRLIQYGELQLAISVPVFAEYQDLLSRPTVKKQLNLDQSRSQTLLNFIAYVGKPYPIRFLWRPNLRDEADNMFVELALASQSSYLITQNTRDFTFDTDLEFDTGIIQTPAQFINHWRATHG